MGSPRPGAAMIRGHAPGPTVLDDAALVRHLYHAEGESVARIAARIGCSQTAAKKALDRHGIVAAGGRRRAPQLDDRRWLRNAYHVRGRTSLQIGAELGCDAHTVLAALRRHGIPVRPKVPATSPLLDDADHLRRRYAGDGASMQQIADELGCSVQPVRWALARHGIEVRQTGRARIGALYD
ncbi:MAG: hypothetical protein LC792_25670, partial [Actinobacteria bacterium]|nr:hypothetical protein [Actinomycetota bacterium]